MLDTFPRRAIHLDFHTGPDIPDVGADFDADTFAAAFADAHVDSVTVFAKCHHGHLYYDTQRPERHPGLAPSLDLLGEQIEALRRRGIHAPIYVTVQVDEYAARQHPDWCAVEPDGRLVKRGGPFAAGWHTLDMSSPYQEYLAEQLAEVLDRFAPMDGLFLDMCWDQPSCSKWAMDGMRRGGYDPADEGARRAYARATALAYMARFKKMFDNAQGGRRRAGIWFNSRPKTNLAVEKKFLRHIEVECLPTGGWGYAYFPYVSRFVRPLGLPTLSMTGRFHRSWGDFGGVKPEAALKYECCAALSQGFTISVGDQLHPRGTVERAAYDRIGRVYAHVAACEPWIEGAKPVTEVAVIIDPERGDNAGPTGLGVVRALQELRSQFDLLPADARLKGYAVVIVPENIVIDAPLRKALSAHLKAGGALMVAGAAAVDASGAPALPELGIRAHGESPFTVTYLRPEKAVARGLEGTDHVMYERGLRLEPAKGARALCRVVEPYFERTYEHFCSHNQTPPDKPSRYAAVVERDRAITFAAPLFTAYGNHANLACRHLLRNCLDRLLPEPLVRDDGPAHLEASVMRKGKRTVVHLLSFYPARRTHSSGLELIEDAFPLVNMRLSLRLGRIPERVTLAPGGKRLDFECHKGRVDVRISTTDGHAMVVFD